MIDGKTKLLGLLGQNIAHTLSPRIHNYAAQRLGINCVYVPLDVAVEDLASVLSGLWRVGAMGFNVTTPHKKAVGKLITGQERSVNTIYRQDGGISATSTDGEGFCAGLAHLGRGIDTFRKVVILGTGGASQALISHFVATGRRFDAITLLRRRDHNDAWFKEQPREFSFEPLTPDGLKAALAGDTKDTLVVQATSAPLRGDNLAELQQPFSAFKGTFVDLVYGTPSALLQQARQMGISCQDGLPMLVEQARVAQQLWWQRTLPYIDLVSVCSSHLAQG